MKLILTLTVCLNVGKVIRFKITMFVVKLKCVFENYNVVSIRIQEQQKHTTHKIALYGIATALFFKKPILFLSRNISNSCIKSYTG